MTRILSANACLYSHPKKSRPFLQKSSLHPTPSLFNHGPAHLRAHPWEFMFMQSNSVNVSNATLSSLLPQRAKVESNAPAFMQVLADAVETATSGTLTAEPAMLAKPFKPRSHLNLVSLDTVQMSYTPEAAALERVSKSRIVPFSMAG